MSIPLDRLYHYLESLSNDNIIIYRWQPHGSKKVEDLTTLRNYYTNNCVCSIQELINLHTNPMLLCHDQEPLSYNSYSCEDFTKRLDSFSSRACVDPDIFRVNMSKLHLRAQLDVLNIFDYTLLCHSEKNSDQLTLYENNHFIGVYYWSHALIARDWFRFAQHDLSLTPNFANIKTDFLIYNRAWSGTREYRLKFAEMLIDNNLTDFCNIKFNPVDQDTHYTQHVFKNQCFELHNKKLEITIKENTSPSWASADYDSRDYQSSAIEVVLETLFDDNRNHLTEKILRPIACGRPFILTSTPGSLQYLRDYGFKTFDGLINEDYDTILDPLERLHCIVLEMKRISNLGQHEKNVLWHKLYQISKYNQMHFFSNDLHNLIVQEFQQNLTQGLAKCHQHVGKWWHWFRSLEGCVETKFTKDVDKFLKDYIDSNF